jgi:DNA-directed RNA polymerase specialized sigma24 family protein
LAFLVCGSEHGAEDIVQTAFASAQRRWASIEDPAAYLRRAVANLAADSHRRRFRERRALQSLDRPVTAIPEIDHTWFVLNRLPTIQRAVVVLHY